MTQRLIDMNSSPANSLEFCLGSLPEMTDGGLDEATDQYTRQGKVAYVYCRNVVGKVPNYKEVFINEGDMDIIHKLNILKRNNFSGVLIPNHT